MTTTCLHVLFPRLFTEEEIREIRNTTFHSVLTSVTSAKPTDLQPHVFTWRQGECSLQWEGTGREWLLQGSKGNRAIPVTQLVSKWHREHIRFGVSQASHLL